MDETLKRIVECIGPRHGAKKELAEYLNIHPNVITNWLNGRNKSYHKYLPQIATYYNVSIDYLLGNESKSDTVTDDPSDEMLQMVKDIAAGKSGSAGLIIGKGGKKPVVHTLSEEEENIMLSILEAMRKNKDN